MKKLHAVLCVIGVILLLAAILLPITVTLPDKGAVIDAPFLVQYMVSDFDDIVFMLWLCGGGLLLGNAPYLIFGRASERGCSLSTSLYSFGLSATGGTGLYCTVAFRLCYFLSSPSKHPITHPMSIFVGTAALCIFVVLICFYVRRRSKRRTIAGILMDGWCALAHLLPCFFGCAYLHDIISAYLRTLWPL